jgi:hypothetical protein
VSSTVLVEWVEWKKREGENGTSTFFSLDGLFYTARDGSDARVVF